MKTSYGDIPIEASRDRDASFDPKVIPKRTTNLRTSSVLKTKSFPCNQKE
ncbi:hypothetical protein EYQ97_16560 [Anaerostipes caccae L1-92]|nr:hypothetical protein EYQ97_16560 [Anaerostipes caccae L1-92]